MASYKTGILSSIEPRLDRAHHIPYAELSAWHCFLTGRLKTQNTAAAATLHLCLTIVCPTIFIRRKQKKRNAIRKTISLADGQPDNKRCGEQ